MNIIFIYILFFLHSFDEYYRYILYSNFATFFYTLRNIIFACMIEGEVNVKVNCK